MKTNHIIAMVISVSLICGIIISAVIYRDNKQREITNATLEYQAEMRFGNSLEQARASRKFYNKMSELGVEVETK